MASVLRDDGPPVAQAAANDPPIGLDGRRSQTAGTRDGLVPWSELTDAEKTGVVEALIFAAEHPVSIRALQEVLGCERDDVAEVVEWLRADLGAQGRGVVLEEVAGGLVFRTRPDFAAWIRKLVQRRPPRLSRAALECLAIVAYQQPVTRAEIEAVRGVESGAVLRTLLEKRLVRVLGRKDDIGRPLIYGTTREFLRIFGLKNLAELPTIEELVALSRRAAPSDRGAGTQ